MLTIYYEMPHSITEGIYYIKNKKSGYYLNVPDSSTTNGQQLIQNSWHGGANQHFKIERTSSNPYTYTIKPMNYLPSAVEAYGYSLNNKVNIWKTPASYSEWRFLSNGNGTYRIMSGWCQQFFGMVVKDASTSLYEQIILQYYNAAVNDQWELIKINPTLLNTPQTYGQEKSLWCWAACAQMDAATFGNNKTQTQIVNYVKGVNNAPDVKGTLLESVTACEYASGTTNQYENKPVSNMPEANLISKLNSGKPVTAQMFVNTNQNGHSVIIFGYRIENGTKYFYIRDPKHDNVGVTFCRTYNELITGTPLAESNYNRAWKNYTCRK